MAIENGSITMDEPEIDIDDAAAQLLKRWQKPKTSEAAPAKEEAPERIEAPVEEHEETEPKDTEEEHEDEQPEEDKPAAERRAASDDDEVVITVGDQEHKVAVKDLKRLFGQEASLTQKSQEVAQVRSQVAVVAQKHATALEAMLKRATDQYEPYKQVDWALAAAKLPAEDYQQLKAAHDAIKANVDYFSTELNETVKSAHEAHAKGLQEAGEKCLQALTNPESAQTYIEGFDQNLYNEIRQYATTSGVPQQLIDSTVDPVAIKLIHKAMLYDKAQKTAVKKLAAAPRNVNKTPTNDGSASRGSARSAAEKLRQSGDPDDAAALLLARWAS